MSWHYSLALEVAFSAANYSDGEPSAQLNESPTPQAYLSPDRMTAFSRLSRFGMTFAPLTGSRGAELLTWFLAGFPVRTSAQPERARESTENEADYGAKWQGSFAKYSPDTRSWKTAQCSLLEDLDEFSETWPRWGSAVIGACFRRPQLERSTYENGYSYLPTPTAHNAKEGAYPAEYTRKTPTLATHAGGKINPAWTEWLMGWPIGWTDLRPLEMDKSQFARQMHGECLEDVK